MTEALDVAFEDLEMDAESVAHHVGVPFTGVAKEILPDGTLRSSTEFVEGLQQGLGREWRCDGSLVRSTTYWGGVKHGTEEEWSPDGHVLRRRLHEFGHTLREEEITSDIARVVDELPADHPAWRRLMLMRQKLPSAPEV